MKSLKNKIFLLFVLLLLVVQAITFWTLYYGNKNQQVAEINTRLTTAKTIFTELFDRRLDYLSAFAETAAKDYGLKQVFNEDTRSLLVALNNHRQRVDADLAMAISADGIITGQLQRNFIVDDSYPSTAPEYYKSKVKQGPELGKEFRYVHWFHSDQTAHLYIIDNALYQLSLSPVNVGTQTIGWIAFGFQIDHRLADEFKSITNLQTDFILKGSEQWQLIATSDQQSTAKQKLALSMLVRDDNTPEQYIATHISITEFDEQELDVYMYGLRANIVSLLQRQWLQFLILAFLTLFVSLMGAYLIAASITKPIKRLVEQAKTIANGNYKETIEFAEQNEIGQLADEFNHMQSAVLQRENAITHFANHDSLTDLPNRNSLNNKLAEIMKQKKHFVLLHLNLSRVKDVNATVGHDVGDEVIKELARRLKLLSKQDDVLLLVHLGADEFILVVDRGEQGKVKVCDVVDEINKNIEPMFSFQGLSLQLQVRIGASLYPEHTNDAVKLVQMADTALHHTRKKNELVQTYQSELDVNTFERLNLINDLKNAIAADQLELHFQPKLCLLTWQVTHAEALVRWHHPTLGMVPPDDFIHIAEQTGQIKALTRWVFLVALAQSKQWDALGLDINIAINISAENLKESDFYEFICRSMTELNIAPEKITLEITESSVVEDPESAISLLGKFKKHGLKISIDDYGTGYSALAQLKQLPVHELKIDKSFVQRLEHDSDDQIIVRSTIDLAHNMGLSVVAEGIEDEFSLFWLAKHKCELAQGYFISKPKPAAELTPWLLNPPKFNAYQTK
ncbi:bifunctional diguanylate cyclase/phosphodiesterase [Psychromonas algicola]|uniref:bifunctional diguanylate cyclase/phosphodiesterase n=1 Tax=Psychromonas algicola TaxID=2555642 RepID=UPI0010676101|nr:EAL domain-containing protein [Psychromonas sp. RZ5]TEW51514.1 EAL domain-containing protein [Psychromonas sp. RZ5]